MPSARLSFRILPSQARPIGGNKVEIYPAGKAYFELLFQRIEEAKVFIHIQIYIISNDETGRRVLDSLAAAVKRGVRVFLMVDAFGTSWMGPREVKRLKRQGIQVKRFSKHPRLRRFFLGRRQHSKLIVIDNEWMSIGGLNFADRYSGMDGKDPWLDVACWVRGPAAAELNRFASAYWPRKAKRYLRKHPAFPPLADGIPVKMVYNDWLRYRLDVREEYRNLINDARTEIILVAAYFLPGNRMLRLLKKKAREGVRIRLLFPSYSDVRFIKPAMEYLYHTLDQYGIEILEWPFSVMHAKMILTDRQRICLGSYNLNILSDYGSLETNMTVDNANLAALVYQYIDQEIIRSSHKAQIRNHVFLQLNRYLSYHLIRFAQNILFLANRNVR